MIASRPTYAPSSSSRQHAHAMRESLRIFKTRRLRALQRRASSTLRRILVIQWSAVHVSARPTPGSRSAVHPSFHAARARRVLPKQLRNAIRSSLIQPASTTQSISSSGPSLSIQAPPQLSSFDFIPSPPPLQRRCDANPLVTTPLPPPPVMEDVDATRSCLLVIPPASSSTRLARRWIATLFSRAQSR